jgi:hypothetical protein
MIQPAIEPSIARRRKRLSWVVMSVAAGSGMFGVISGFAVFLLWNDQISEHPALFLLGLAVAAAVAYVTETLRDLIRTGEPETPTPRRILTSFVTLASLEIFIIAWHSIVDIFEQTRNLHTGADAGNAVVEVVGAIVGMSHPSALLAQFAILVGIWVATGATVGIFFCRLVFLRERYRPGEGIVRAVWAALASAALVMAYVVIIRLVLSIVMLFTQPAVVANGYARLLADMTYQVSLPIVEPVLSWWQQIATIIDATAFRQALATVSHGDIHAAGPLALQLAAIAIALVTAVIFMRIFLPYVILGAALAIVVAFALASILGFASLVTYNAGLAIVVGASLVVIVVMVIAAVIVALLRGDVIDRDDAVRILVPLGIVVGLPTIGLAALLVAPLLVDWRDLLTLPLMVFVVWVLPMIVLAVAIPYLRRPSPHTRAWAAIAAVAALLIAVITFIAVAGTLRWIGLAATAAIAAGGYALSKQEDVTDVWPIAAISLAVISCAGTLVLADVTASFRGVFTRVAEITMLPQDFPLYGVDIDRGARLVAVLQAQEPKPVPRPASDLFGPLPPQRIPGTSSPKKPIAVSSEALRALSRYPLGCEPQFDFVGNHFVERPMKCRPLPNPTTARHSTAALGAHGFTTPAPLPTINPLLERSWMRPSAPTLEPTVAIAQQRIVLERRLACIVRARHNGMLDALYAPLLARPAWSVDALRARFDGAEAALEPACASAVADAAPANVDDLIAREQTAPRTPAERVYEADLGHLHAAFDQLDRYEQAVRARVAPAVANGAAATPAVSIDVVARALEVCLAGSTAFWLSVAFLATWQMRAVFEREQSEGEPPPSPSPPADSAVVHA